MNLRQDSPPSPRQWARERRAILEKPLVERTEAEAAYLEGFDLGHAYPAHTSDALAGLMDGKKAAQREARR